MEISTKLSENRKGLINDFIALEPLLIRLGLGGSSTLDEQQTPTSVSEALPALDIPDFNFTLQNHDHLPEEIFFERFVHHVENSGFIYDRMDLLAFHLSAKERAPVILGGVSGSGKSSLPLLYAEAIAGDGIDDD